jgi:Tol biopolymer transport system component
MVNVLTHRTGCIGMAVAATLVVAAFGGSQPKGVTGTIAFVAGERDVVDLYVIRPDGTRLRQVTRDGDDRVEQSPSWSPDGKSIAFISTTWRPQNHQYIPTSAITVIAANGSRRRILFRTKASQLPLYDLAWSPNGRRIAFTWYRDPPGAYELWLLRMDGTADAFTSPSGAASPNWAPDGKRLAYVGQGGIFVANVRTRSARLLRGTKTSGCPRWSPNGRWIAVCTFHGSGAKRFQSLDVLTPTGGHRRQLVKAGLVAPYAWAPDSEAILFGRSESNQGFFAAAPLFLASLPDGRVTPVPGTVGAGQASWHR